MNFSTLLLLAAVFFQMSAGTMLYNGLQSWIFPSNMSTACSAAFNTSIDCPADVIQLVAYSSQTVGWNTTTLTQLCTSECSASLSTLETAVNSACGLENFNFNSLNMTYVQVIQFFEYKHGMLCLSDSHTNELCSDVSDSWNISAMNQAGGLTWPENTEKLYPWPYDENWAPLQDVNGSYIYPFEGSMINTKSYEYPPTAMDYYMDRTQAVGDDNYGWNVTLEFDEYPLEIQCSECFLNMFLYGFEAAWGDIWDEVTEQIWNNMKSNCNFTNIPVPANNYTGRNPENDWWNSTESETTQLPSCSWQSVNTSSPYQTCQEFCLENQISVTTLTTFNEANCGALGDEAFCIPPPCEVTIVPQMQASRAFVAQYDNITWTQFAAWNPFISAITVLQGDVVCVGPQGGSYTPTLAGQAYPTSFTTTAIPNAPTNTGTIPNCGLYYEVGTGDFCNSIAMNFSITFDQFRDMNPSVNANCTNLFLNFDYCVAPVANSTVPPLPSSASAASSAAVETRPVATPHGAW